MNSRSQILGKLSKFEKPGISSIPSEINDKTIFNVFSDPSTFVDKFTKNFQALNGEIYIVKNLEDAGNELVSIISSLDNKKCLSHTTEVINKLFSINHTLSEIFDILNVDFLDSDIFSTYEVGLTTVDFLIARTGSIVLNSLTAGGRRLSVLPPIHIVLAEIKKIVFSLDDIFKNNFTSNDWSYSTIISGPSRTSDIEKQLVLGAHGPKRVIVILIENI